MNRNFHVFIGWKYTNFPLGFDWKFHGFLVFRNHLILMENVDFTFSVGLRLEILCYSNGLSLIQNDYGTKHIQFQTVNGVEPVENEHNLNVPISFQFETVLCEST